MQRRQFHRNLCVLLTLSAVVLFSGVGCARRAFRASSLPPQLAAPPCLDLESLNLATLANQSVSVEVLQPGDVLDISMISDYEKLTTTTTPVRVAEDGTVSIPLVGRVKVGGLQVEQAEQVINSESISRGVFRTPCITVTMKQYRTCKVTVLGAVNNPGVHALPRGSSSLMAALVAAGGLSKDAGTEVEIRRTDSRRSQLRPLPATVSETVRGDGVVPAAHEQSTPLPPVGPETIQVDLLATANGTAPVPELSDGDVVQVAKRTLPPVYVIGLVQKPGQFEYPTDKEIRVLDALAMAGGVSNAVAEDIVVLRRVAGQSEPARIAVSLQGAKNGRDNLLLAPGDTVSVERTTMTAVVDILQTFLRFGVGTSVSLF